MPPRNQQSSSSGGSETLPVPEHYACQHTHAEYVPFKYERVADMVEIRGPGDYIYTMNNKSGYWQMSMHESMHTYLGMKWNDSVWVWAHLPFALAPACRLNMLLKQEVYRPL